MKILLAPLLGLAFSVSAAQDMLHYLYLPALDPDASHLLDRVSLHARNEEFEHAITLSQTLLREADALQDSDPAAYGELLINHGIIQSASAEPQPGLENITRGLAFMETRTNPFDRKLINGLMARGVTALSLSLHDQARDSFRRAQHITHRHGGVYSADQTTMLLYLARTFLQEGKPLSADQQQKFSLKVAEQVHGSDSPALLPTLNRLGSYFASRGNTIPFEVSSEFKLQRDTLFKDSITMYRRSVSIIEQRFGENDLRLVPPLRGMASAWMLQITNRRLAEKALLRALGILETNPDSALKDRARAQVDLGDLYIVTSADEQAATAYLRAWEILQDAPDKDSLEQGFFGWPVLLFPESFPTLYLKRHPDAAAADAALFIDLTYNVTAGGRVKAVEVVAKNVPNEQVRLLRQKVRQSRFRPRIVDGEMVATEGLRLHQPFKVPDRPEPEDKAEGATDGSTVSDDKVT